MREKQPAAQHAGARSLRRGAVSNSDPVGRCAASNAPLLRPDVINRVQTGGERLGASACALLDLVGVGRPEAGRQGIPHAHGAPAPVGFQSHPIVSRPSAPGVVFYSTRPSLADLLARVRRGDSVSSPLERVGEILPVGGPERLRGCNRGARRKCGCADEGSGDPALHGENYRIGRDALTRDQRGGRWDGLLTVAGWRQRDRSRARLSHCATSDSPAGRGGRPGGVGRGCASVRLREVAALRSAKPARASRTDVEVSGEPGSAPGKLQRCQR